MRMNDRPSWPTRYLRVAAGLTVAVAILLWITPVNVPGRNLVPFGCGSPSDPAEGELARFVCTNELDNLTAFAVALLIVAGVQLLMGEVAVTRWRVDRKLLASIIVAPVVLPLFAWSVVSMFLVVGAVAADGTLIRCGTAIAPAADTISVGLCGQLPERRLHLGLGGALLAVGILAGARYVGRERLSPALGVADSESAAGSDTGDAA